MPPLGDGGRVGARSLDLDHRDTGRVTQPHVHFDDVSHNDAHGVVPTVPAVPGRTGGDTQPVVLFHAEEAGTGLACDAETIRSIVLDRAGEVPVRGEDPRGEFDEVEGGGIGRRGDDKEVHEVAHRRGRPFPLPLEVATIRNFPTGLMR